MKIAAIALLIILAVITCGCTSPAPVATPATTTQAVSTPAAATTQAPPDITGTWNGPMTGYESGIRFTDYGNYPMTMNVTGQQGRIFAGTFTFTDANGSMSTGFSGVIGRDGRTLTIPQESGGYSFGEIISPTEIELTYVDDGTHSTSAIDTLRKV